MSKKKSESFSADVPYEGKNEAYVDIDRMINEGMSGGSVHNRAEYKNIEEARDLKEESPPNKN